MKKQPKDIDLRKKKKYLGHWKDIEKKLIIN